jgi:demethylspheroidene O-methyltransferase
VSRWLHPFYSARDRLLADPRFQRFASSSLLLRPIARRRARSLFDLCAGFVYSQVLLAAVRLGLFETLREGPLPISSIAARLSLSPESTRRLLAAAAELGLAARRGADCYGLGMHGAALLANPGLARMIEHNALLYADLADPVALLRGEAGETRLARYWPYADDDAASRLTPAETDSYTALMAASQTLVADQILDAYTLAGHTCLLDVGGGDGTFLRSATRRWPHLRVMLFDLPTVAARARAAFDAAGLADRASAIGGDFRRDALPAGADVVSLVRVLHDHDDDVAQELLCAARRALKPGGTVLVAEPMSAAPAAGAVGDVYFSFYLMAMGRGRPRTGDELSAMMRRAGLTGVRPIATRLPLQTSLIVARA